MTLEEKVGQMTQVTFAVIAKGGWGDTEGNVDPAALKKAIADHHVGSILNVNAHGLTVDKWNSIITQIQDEAKNTTIKNSYCLWIGWHAWSNLYTELNFVSAKYCHGSHKKHSTMCNGCCKVTAKELRASGVRWNFAPVLDFGRQPLWSRFPETYGEDVYIGKTMGAAVIKAYEEDGLKNPTAVASCMKHYLGYSGRKNRQRQNACLYPGN